MSEVRKIGIESSTWIEGGAIVQSVVLTDPIQDVRDQIVKFRMDTCDAQIREALIRLGWTPPGESE